MAVQLSHPQERFLLQNALLPELGVPPAEDSAAPEAVIQMLELEKRRLECEKLRAEIASLEPPPRRSRGLAPLLLVLGLSAGWAGGWATRQWVQAAADREYAPPSAYQPAPKHAVPRGPDAAAPRAAFRATPIDVAELRIRSPVDARPSNP